MDISLLEHIYMHNHHSIQHAVQHSVQIAQLAESYRFKRIWLSEHHNQPNIASSTPSIYATYIGSMTKKIRIGVGGFVFPYHAPIQIVEQSSALAAILPNRIDIGITRANPIENTILRAIWGASNKKYTPIDFIDHIDEIVALFSRSYPEQHAFYKLSHIYQHTKPPELFILGSSLHSATIAAQYGLNFAYGVHHDEHHMRLTVEQYHAYFKPTLSHQKPCYIVNCYLFIGDTYEQAMKYAQPTITELTKRLMLLNKNELTEKDIANRMLIGTKEDIYQKLLIWRHQFNIHEVIIHNRYDDVQYVHKCFEAIAEVTNLLKSEKQKGIRTMKSY